MIKHKWIEAATVLLMAAVVLLTGFTLVNPDVFASITGKSEPAYASAMDKTQIMSFQIIADETQWADMLENATAEEYIPATVIINGTKIDNAGIRPKGNSSLSMVAQDDTTDRFSFKIEFDHYITGQTWLGLDKIVINNMQGDATYMKEYLSYDIMDFIGVDAPLYAFADITLNGEAWGFYLAVEALDDSYAERVYGNDHGKLYKPESMGGRGGGRMNEFIQNAGNTDGKETLQQEESAGGQMPQQEQMPGPEEQGLENKNSGGFAGGMSGMASDGVSLQYTDGEISSYSAIFDNSVFDTAKTDYNRVINSLESLSKSEDLEDTADVEAVLKYFAAHTVVVNLDSYVSTMGHNYYLYEKDGKLAILPWDYNLAFGGFQSGNASDVVNFPIDTPVSGVSLEERPLLGRLLEVPEYLEMYHNYLQDIVDGYFNSGTFEQTIDSLNALISGHVETDATAFYDIGTYQRGIIELKELGLLRAQSIEGQLNGTIPSAAKDQDANPGLLVDAASVDLEILGRQGRGKMEGRGEEGSSSWKGGGMQDLDREVIKKAMEILRTAGDNELTEAQLSELQALGLSEGQITGFKNTAQGGLGGKGDFDRQRPDNEPRSSSNVPGDMDQVSGAGGAAIIGNFDTNTGVLIGICVILLLFGLVFVVLFRRRRSI